MKHLFFISILSISLQCATAQCYMDRHSTNWMDAWISCEKNPSPNISNSEGHWILYDLKERYDIDKIKFWNINDPAHLSWGIRRCKIEYSGNQQDWFNAGEFILEQGTGSPIYEGMNWINIRMPEARYVLITALSNYGKDDCYGFAELLFSAEKTVITSVDEQKETDFLNVNVSPNPMDHFFIAQIESSPGKELHYQCIDLLGKVIEQGKVEMTESKHYLKVFTEDWPAGNYRLVLIHSGRSKVVPLIKLK